MNSLLEKLDDSSLTLNQKFYVSAELLVPLIADDSINSLEEAKYEALIFTHVYLMKLLYNSYRPLYDDFVNGMAENLVSRSFDSDKVSRAFTSALIYNKAFITERQKIYLGELKKLSSKRSNSDFNDDEELYLYPHIIHKLYVDPFSPIDLNGYKAFHDGSFNLVLLCPVFLMHMNTLDSTARKMIHLLIGGYYDLTPQ